MISLSINDETLIATTAGALYWPERETLIVSDLHFEKGSHFATKGVLLPPYDTRTTLRRIATLMKARRPKTVISLGDAFHDGDAEARMDDDDAAMLEALAQEARWIWILGNHDPAPPNAFSGAVERTLRLGRLLFRALCRRRRRGAGAAMQPHVAEPQIVGVAGALVGRQERNAALRRRVGVGARPGLPGVVALEDRGADHREEHVSSSGETASEHWPPGSGTAGAVVQVVPPLVERRWPSSPHTSMMPAWCTMTSVMSPAVSPGRWDR